MHRFRLPRRVWRPAAALLAGAALFASGAFVANALDGGDGGEADSPPPASGATGVNRTPLVDGAGAGGSTASPGVAVNYGETAGKGSADGAMTRPWGGCQVPIPGALTDGKIDPSGAGVDARFLGSGFELTGFNIRAETDCWAESPTGETVVTIDTQWKHTDSGLSVYLSQRQDGKPMASVLDETSARFWKGRYAFSVNVDGYSVQTLAGAPEKDPGFAPGPDPRAGEVLRAALAYLNPPPEACFYVARDGSFDDLAGLGIGDPRSAIPGNYSLQQLFVRTWSTPDPGCDTPSEGLQASFNATWTAADGERESQAIFVGAYAMAPGEQGYPGNVNEYGANWNNGAYHFNIGAQGTQPLGREAVLALARALDPGFANACVAEDRSPSADELAGLGINTPTTPEGYTVARSSASTTELKGNCTGEERQNFGENVHAEWTLVGPDGAVIDARANKSSNVPPEKRAPGFINENGLWWWTDSGVQYEVFGYVEGRPAFPPQETLIAIAKSLDPNLNVDELQKNGGYDLPGSPPVKPLGEPAIR